MSTDAVIAALPEFADAIKAFFFENETRDCIVDGHSMEPFLSMGEKVKIVPVTGSLKKGHCYAFITGNTLTIHRFIKNFGSDSALFIGDSNFICDRVPVSNIVGELSPCQSIGALIIIRTINSAFCTFVDVFDKAVLIRIFRRHVIRSITGLTKTKGRKNGKKIRKTGGGYSGY